jgi:hypothetical protein
MLDHHNTMTEREVDAVRDCLRSITDEERPRLWALLDGMRLMIGYRELAGIRALVNRAPAGPIRRCLARIAQPVLDTHATLVRTAATKPGYVYGRAQPAFLGMFTGCMGVVAPVDVWSCRDTFWEKVDPDAFYDIHTGGHGHIPVPLDWRHRPDAIVGLSRQWTVRDDGTLRGRFDIGPTPAAQLAARLAQSDEGLGLSVSVRFDTQWLAHLSPNEWDPSTGAVDVCVRRHANVESVALTPTPTFPSARVKWVW